MAMELLYKCGGMKGEEIGHMMGLDYSTVNQGRKGLRESKKLQGLGGEDTEEVVKNKDLTPNLAAQPKGRE